MIEPQTRAIFEGEAADALMKSFVPQIVARAKGSHAQSCQTQSNTSKSESPEGEHKAKSGNSRDRGSESSNLVDSNKDHKLLGFPKGEDTPYPSVSPGRGTSVTGSSDGRASGNMVDNAGIQGTQWLRFADDETSVKRDARIDSRKEQRHPKRRKLSNAATPIDICEPMDDDSI